MAPRSSFRPPATFVELQEVPAVKAIFDALNTQEATKQQCDEALSQSVREFNAHKASPTSPEAAEFLTEAYIPKTRIVDAGLRLGAVD